MMKLKEAMNVKSAQLKESFSSLKKNKRFKKFLPLISNRIASLMAFSTGLLISSIDNSF